MKKTITALSLSVLICSPVMADKPDYDISDKPPEFKPLPDEFGITVKRTEPDDVEVVSKEAEKVRKYTGDHNPEDHDHDHDDAEDLDHEHDDPKAHEKQIKEAEMRAQEQEEQKWWKFW